MPVLAVLAALLLVSAPFDGERSDAATQPVSDGLVLAFDDEIGRDWENDDSDDRAPDDYYGSSRPEDDDDHDGSSAHGPDEDEADFEEFERSERA
jgi:hypothetical protein